MSKIAAGREADNGECTVIVFPLRWRVGKARRTAEAFLSMTPKGRDGYWRKVLNTLDSQLEKLGCNEDSIAEELKGFTKAVQAEVDRMQRRTSEPSGAA